jgi:hypothetical protein
LDWIFPAGAQRGAQIDVVVGGTDLEEGHELYFSNPKLSATPKRTSSNEFYADGQVVANQFTVKIGEDISPGLYEVQVVGRHGLSTSRVFQVTNFVEVIDNANNHSAEQAQVLAVGQLVNGRTDAEQSDFYVVEVPADEEFTCEIWSRRIDSQADVHIEVCNANGIPLTSLSRSQRRDPSLSFKAPAAGKYLIRVQDVTYRGGEPYFYRMAVHREPVVRAVLPPVAHPNGEAEFTLFGERVGTGTGAAAGTPNGPRVVKAAVHGKEILTTTQALIVAEPRELDV